MNSLDNIQVLSTPHDEIEGLNYNDIYDKTISKEKLIKGTYIEDINIGNTNIIVHHIYNNANVKIRSIYTLQSINNDKYINYINIYRNTNSGYINRINILNIFRKNISNNKYRKLVEIYEIDNFDDESSSIITFINKCFSISNNI